MEPSVIFLVVKILFLITVSGAPLEQNATAGDREHLSETTQNSLLLNNKIKSALMSSIPTLRYVNNDKNFDVKFRENDSGTTKKLYIINNLNTDNVKQIEKSFDNESLRRNSNVFDSILSKPLGAESTFGEKTSRRVVLKSRRIIPNNQDLSSNKQASVKEGVLLDKITEFTKNDNNGSSNSRIESDFKVSHEVGHDSDANQGHEESKNKHDWQPNLNVTPIRNNSESINNDGKYRRPQISPRVFSTPDRPKDFYKYSSESTDVKDDNDNTDKNKYYLPTPTPSNERTSLQNEINTLDVYSRLSEIENILAGTNNDKTNKTETEKNNGDKSSSLYVEPFSNNVSLNKENQNSQEAENDTSRSTGTKKYTSIQRNPPNRSRSRYNFRENSRAVYETIKNEEDLFNQNYPRETIEKLRNVANQVDNKTTKQADTIKQDKDVNNSRGSLNNFSLSPNQSNVKNNLMNDEKSQVVNKDSSKISDTENTNKIIRNQPNRSQNTLNVRQRTRTNERKTYGDDVLKQNYPRETIVDNLRNTSNQVDDQTTERSSSNASRVSGSAAYNKNNDYTTIEWIKVKPTPAATLDSENINREKVLLRNGNFNRDGRIDKTDANQNSQIIKVQNINESSQVGIASPAIIDSAQVSIDSRVENVSQKNINENVSSVINRGRTYLNNEVPERGNNLLNTGRNKDFGKTLVDEIIKESDENDLGLRTEESSYYGDNSKQTSNGFTSHPIIVEVEETTRFKVDNYYSNRHKTIESKKHETENENNSRISLDLNERGSRKFLPSRFETISPYITDSMTKKLYTDLGDEIRRSDKTGSRTQILEGNTIETRYKSVANPYRGSIKYEPPKNYDWYDYNDDLYNSGEVGSAPAQFGFMYQAPNGTDVYQKGTLKKINNKKVFVIHGSYKYISPDGTPISVTYTADENGFHPLETKITDTVYKPKDEIRTNLRNEIELEDVTYTQEVTTTEEPTNLPAGEDRDFQDT